MYVIWLSAFGYQLSAIGYQLSAIGFRLSVIGKTVIGPYGLSRFLL